MESYSCKYSILEGLYTVRGHYVQIRLEICLQTTGSRYFSTVIDVYRNSWIASVIPIKIILVEILTSQRYKR